MPLFYQILSIVSITSVLPALILGLVQWKRLDQPLKIIAWLLILSLSTDISSILLVLNRMNTMQAINLYLLVQFLLVSILIYIQSGKQKFIIGLSALSMIYFIIDLLLFPNASILITYGNAALSAICIFYGVYYLKKVLDELPFEDITKTPIFWAIFGLLSFYAGTFFLFLFDKLMSQYPNLHRDAWIIAPVSNIIKNSLTAIALWINLKNKN